MTLTPSWSPVDHDTGSLLDLLVADWRPFAEADRNTVAAAIREDAEVHGGWVSQNRVRAALASLPVVEQPKPQRVGPVYRALCLQGVLVAEGYEVSDDLHGRNSGRPCKAYRWVGEPS